MILINLIKMQLFIILSFYYRMKISQRPIVGHVQMTFIVNQSSLSSTYQIQKSGKLSNLFVWSIWLAGEIPWDGNYKGRLYM